MKTCPRCGVPQSSNMFNADARRPDGLNCWCKSCNNESAKARYAAMSAEQKRAVLIRKYGITVEEHDAALEAQGGVCGICKTPCSVRPNLAIDHCHKTGKFRGLLCSKCNSAIGYLNDDLDTLRAAVAYLEDHTQ